MEELALQIFKKVSRQSERQFGAFVFVRALVDGTSPSVLSQASVKFRNKVVHKGVIPTRRQAQDFGRSVWNCIRPDFESLQNKLREDQSDSVSQCLASIKSELIADVGLDAFTTGGVQTIRLTGAFCMKVAQPIISFDEALGLQQESSCSPTRPA